jgi:hypothetical protein
MHGSYNIKKDSFTCTAYLSCLKNISYFKILFYT